jgi:hypothetical protein
MLHLRNIAVLACILLAGCASVIDRHPKIAYADKHHPLSDTAIFSCVDVPGFTCGIARVDDISTWNHYNGGMTLWVRVLPGSRHIQVIASNGQAVNFLSFDAEDVQPGHAYSIEIAEAPPPASLPAAAGSHGKRNKQGQQTQQSQQGGKQGKQQVVVSASLSVSYQDLGKMDSYTVLVGQKTFHSSKLTAHF